MSLQQTAKLRRVCNCSQVKLTREANWPSQLTKTTKSEFSKRPLKVFKSSRILARINKPWIYIYIFSHLDFACFVRKPVVFLNAARLRYQSAVHVTVSFPICFVIILKGQSRWNLSEARRPLSLHPFLSCDPRETEAEIPLGCTLAGWWT